MKTGVLGAFLAGSLTVAVGVPAVSAAGPFTIATSPAPMAFQHSAQDKVAFLHDGSLLVGHYDGVDNAAIDHVTSPSTAPSSTQVEIIPNGSEVTFYTLRSTNSTEIWVATGSELTGGVKQEQVQYGTYNGSTFSWGAVTVVPGSLTSGRQDPSVTWTGKWLITSWWDDTLGGNTDTVFYNWTTTKQGTGGWHVPAKSGTTAAAAATKSGTSSPATVASATSIHYNPTTGAVPATNDVLEFGAGTPNSDVRSISGAVQEAGTTAAATLANATTITYTAATGVPAVGDVFTFGTGLTADVRTVAGVSGSAPYTLTVASLTNAHAMSEADTGPYTLTVGAFTHPHAVGETVTIGAAAAGATTINYTGTAPAPGDNFQIGTAISNDGLTTCGTISTAACDADFVQVTSFSAGIITFSPALSNGHAVNEPVRIAASLLTPTFSNSVQVSIRHSTKLGATIAVYGGHCRIFTRTLLDGASDPSPLNWTTESQVDSGSDDCEGNFGGPQIAIDEASGNIHVFKAVTTLNGPSWSGITYWLGTPDGAPMSSGTVSWSSRLIIDATGTNSTNPPDIAGTVDPSTGNVYVYWATGITGGAIKFVTLVSPYTAASPAITVPSTGTNPRYPHVPAQMPLTGGYVPLVYENGSGTYSIVLQTNYPDVIKPTVPTGLTATANGVPSVVLNWAASTDNVGVTGYSIYRDGSLTALATVSGSTLTYTDTTVVQGHTYSYTVDAFDAAGNHSAKSAPASANTADTTPPTVPTGLGASATTTPSVVLNWTASTDNVGVTGYSVYRDGNATALATVSGSTTTYTDSAVVDAHMYSYTVDAFDAAGNHSAKSAPATVNTPDITAPTVPTGLAASATRTPSVVLTWNASTDNVAVTGYTVYRGGSKLTTVSSSTLTYTDTTVIQLTNYTYTVDAFDAAGNHSAQSAVVNANVPDSTPPSVPTGLTASFVPTPVINLAWNASTDNVGVTGYTIYRNGTMLTTVSGSTLTYVDAAIVVSVSYVYTVDAFDAAGNHSAQSPSAVINPGVYTAIAPKRLLDTRTNGTKLGAGASMSLPISGTNGVPGNASAVILNVTAVNETTAGFFTVFPTGSGVPTASNLNWVAGETVPNLVSVGLGTGGSVTIYNGLGMADAVVDLEGYFAPSSGGTAGEFVPVVPARITDTRAGSGKPNAGATLGAGSTLPVQVTGVGGIPSTGVTAVVLNATVTDTTSAGFLTVYPTGMALPVASNLNWMPGVTVPNRVIVPVGLGGVVSFYNGLGSADLVVDVNGYFTDSSGSGASFVPVTPSRITDTRLSGTPLGAGATMTVTVAGVAGVPANAKAAVLNVTVVSPTVPSALTVWPNAALRPVSSDLNFVGGQTVPNLVVVKLSVTGQIDIYNLYGSTNVVVDVVGWYG